MASAREGSEDRCEHAAAWSEQLIMCVAPSRYSQGKAAVLHQLAVHAQQGAGVWRDRGYLPCDSSPCWPTAAAHRATRDQMAAAPADKCAAPGSQLRAQVLSIFGFLHRERTHVCGTPGLPTTTCVTSRSTTARSPSWSPGTPRIISKQQERVASSNRRITISERLLWLSSDRYDLPPDPSCAEIRIGCTFTKLAPILQPANCPSH